MTAFLENIDLVRHMFTFIDKKDRPTATLVGKEWRKVSETFLDWRELHRRVSESSWPEPTDGIQILSVGYLELILEHLKHIVRCHFHVEYQSSDWWANLASYMPHI